MQAIRYKMAVEQVTVIMDAAQRMAFDYDAEAFLVWSENLTPQYYLEFVSAGYVSAVIGDIGKTVVQGSNTGTLISYNNTTRKWLLSTTSTFTDSGTVTITTGTGAGTLLSTASQTGYKGPYSVPTDPAVRKLWGVTTETDTRIFGSDDATVFPMQDFDFLPRLFDPTKFFKAGRENGLDRTFTFVDDPALPSTLTVYRWVYWRDAPTLSEDDDVADETKILIPSTYHMNFVNACIKLAQLNLSGDDVDPKVIAAFFQPWWNTLARPYTPMGNATNQTLNPRGRSGILI